MNYVNYFTLVFIISATTSITFCDDVNSQLDSSESTKTAEKSFYGSYRWEEMRINYVLPEDVVYGGQNAGLEPLFVVRGKSNNYNYFGKLPMPYSTRDAYLTNESREFATKDFHILTAKGYS
ncbi:unnamed protein product [Chironomus riparius]|uniref:Uncharacterized protein n=1 Tax=Chironomus riparius TaxID=315576 RepID=A0A9N9S9B0_9DIPT|nr:unnamed protein product [Chironomus riparius]